MQRFHLCRLVSALCFTGLLGFSDLTMAAAFQLWEQDGASIANFHAGYAAEANNASVAWYNPAGITRIKNPQLLLASDGVITSFKYQGTAGTSTFDNHAMQTVTAQGGVATIIPAIHYAAPITDRIGFGLSLDVPFGSKIDYGTNTFLRYVTTRTLVEVVDLSPSLGVRIVDGFSVGAGFDVQRMRGEFDSKVTTGQPELDETSSTNKANDTAYGYHLGALYEFSPNTRIGLSYHSQVAHHLTGSSKFVGPIADDINSVYFDHPAPIIAQRSSVNITLPAYTALSIYNRTLPKLALMGTLTYTQWNCFRELSFHNFAGVDLVESEFGINPGPSNAMTVTIPQHFRNTFNISVGGDYFVTDAIILRSGVGYDETPVSNRYRNAQLPDNNHYVIGFGSHFQTTKTIGLDIGWSHVFISSPKIHPEPQEEGFQTVYTDGRVKGGADVYGAQVVWDIV